MIDVYTWPTPNGHKVHIMLEECGLPYLVHAINIRTGEQFHPDFLQISPNNRIPAIVDHDGPDGAPLSLFESGAILFYLATKTRRFLPSARAQYFTAMQWLMWQMGGVGPMFGQANHFRGKVQEAIPYAAKRYTDEANRLTRVLDARLAQVPYLAGGEYSIADIAVFPWLRNSQRLGVDLATYPAAQRWFDAIAARPAVARGVAVLAEHQRPIGPSTEAASRRAS